MSKVHAKNDGVHFVTNISNSNLSLIADLPIASGGTNAGFSPIDLLASALAACTAMFITDYCKKHNYVIFGVDVEVRVESNDDESETHFIRDIKIQGNISQDLKQEVFDAAKSCHLHNILSGNISIQSNLR